MKHRLLYLLKLILLLLGSFIFFRLVFVIYHYDLIKAEMPEIFQSFVHGFALDVSATGYILAPILLLLIGSIFIKSHFIEKTIKFYVWFCIFLCTLIYISDLRLYTEWGFRLNNQVLIYLTNPKEAFASASSGPFISLLISIVFLSVLFAWIYSKWIHKSLFVKVKKEKPNAKMANIFVLLLVGGLNIVAIRGGLQLIPINQSAAFFSSNPGLNQSALNVPWNIAYYLMDNKGMAKKEDFNYMDTDEANQIFEGLYSEGENGAKLFKDGLEPNILIIGLESWTADAIYSLGGIKNATPGFEKLIKEGLFFTNIYANGDRTDKGLVAINSAFPSQQTTSIITQPDKVKMLDALSKTLKKEGYNTGFFYGGESEFANMKAYLLATEFDKITDKNNFESNQANSKWGVHDELIFDKVISELKSTPSPFYNLLLTLSSHEPFEFPGCKISGDEQQDFIQSVKYTDSCLYDFIQKAKQSDWYKNTLIVLVADHGHRLIGGYNNNYQSGKFRIPVLFMGGALNNSLKGTTEGITGNQTDIAQTIISGLGLEPDGFKYSKNLMSKNQHSWATYSFNNGIGWIDGKGNSHVWDNNSKSWIGEQPDANTAKKIHAFQQKFMWEYIDF